MAKVDWSDRDIEAYIGKHALRPKKSALSETTFVRADYPCWYSVSGQTHGKPEQDMSVCSLPYHGESDPVHRMVRLHPRLQVAWESIRVEFVRLYKKQPLDSEDMEILSRIRATHADILRLAMKTPQVREVMTSVIADGRLPNQKIVYPEDTVPIPFIPAPPKTETHQEKLRRKRMELLRSMNS